MYANIQPEVRAQLLRFQKAEITGHHVYRRIAAREKDEKNRRVLFEIASDELEHYGIWKQYTGRDISPNWFQIGWYVLLSVLLGFTFVVKKLELDEDKGGKALLAVERIAPEARKIMETEEAHEAMLVEMLDEERLNYVGAMVLGLNDALVELTGVIAGLTFAFSNNRLVALSAIITGASATLSMAASNFLAERADGNPHALKSSLYTGVAYLVTVVLLVLPYLLYPAHLYVAALATMLAVVVLEIFLFNYYVSVAKSLPFWRRFGEMAGISLSVAAISFLIGVLAKRLLGIDV